LLTVISPFLAEDGIELPEPDTATAAVSWIGIELATVVAEIETEAVATIPSEIVVAFVPKRIQLLPEHIMDFPAAEPAGPTVHTMPETSAAE
jgi:hypothetical protein